MPPEVLEQVWRQRRVEAVRGRPSRKISQPQGLGCLALTNSVYRSSPDMVRTVQAVDPIRFNTRETCAAYQRSCVSPRGGREGGAASNNALGEPKRTKQEAEFARRRAYRERPHRTFAFRLIDLAEIARQQERHRQFIASPPRKRP
jgi:hypothetical protein